MRTFVVCAGIFGRPEALDWLVKVVDQRRPDGILFAGGVLPWPRNFAPSSTGGQFGYQDKDVAFLESFFDTFGNLQAVSTIIPGVSDAPLEAFLQIGMQAELEYPNLHLVHATPFYQGDVAIFGLGACINGYTDLDLGYYSRSLAEYYFRGLWTVKERDSFVLLAEPPQSWHNEEEDIRLAHDLVSTYHPRVCAIGCPVTRRGTHRIGGTTIVYPGHLIHGQAAWVDCTRAENVVEFIERTERGSLRLAPHSPQIFREQPTR